MEPVQWRFDEQGRMHHVKYVSLGHSAQNITLRSVLENSLLAISLPHGLSENSPQKAVLLCSWGLCPSQADLLGWACWKLSCSSDGRVPLGSLLLF